MSGITNPWQRLQAIAPALIGAILFSLSVWAIRQEIHHYGWQNVLDSLQKIPDKHLLGAVILMIINYILLTGYDILAIFFIGKSLPYLQTGFVSFISYAVSNSVGLALLSSSAIRYRFYTQWGLSNGEIAKIILFCNLSFWVGLLSVGGITFLANPLLLPSFLRLPFVSVRPLGILFLILTLSYLGLGLSTRKSIQLGRWRLPHIPPTISLMQMGITAIDWGLAAAILYVLLPIEKQFSYFSFFSIYLLAQIVGLISNIPGGLGVFETIILFSLNPFFSSVKILGALLGYRVIYYWIPLGMATLSLGIYEICRHFQQKQRK